MPGRFSLIGKGRAGGSIHAALVDLGWECTAVFGRHDDVSEAATSVDVCIIATPDRSIASVAGAIRQGDAEGTSGVVLHLSGALGLDVWLLIAVARCTRSFRSRTPTWAQRNYGLHGLLSRVTQSQRPLHNN